MTPHADFSQIFQESRAFLAELAQNNTRDWFQENKARFDAALKRPAEALLHELSPVLADLGGSPVKPKLFRQHRDLRYSKDKTPYNTHLHLAWGHADGRGWFLGISPDYATAGAGIMGFERGQLDVWRAAVDHPDGEELAGLLAQGRWRLDSPALKRVPAPYPADHPRGDLLRRKGLVAWVDNLEGPLERDPKDALRSVFGALAPLQRWLGTHVT